MKLGIFTEYVAAVSIEELAEKIAGWNLESVVLSSYPGLDIDLDRPSKSACQRIASAFSQAGVKIAAVSGYSNLVHQDRKEREQIHRRFRGLMQLSELVESPMICTETGTFHPQLEWEWDPSNATDQALDQLVDVLHPFVGEASTHGIQLALEPYVMNIAHSPARAVELIERLNASHVKLVADPAGMLTRATLGAQESVMSDMFARITPHIGLVHAEDCRPDPVGHFEWLGAGEGLIDYPLFMKLLLQSGYQGPVILEHLTEEGIERSRDFTLKHWEAVITAEQEENK